MLQFFRRTGDATAAQRTTSLAASQPQTRPALSAIIQMFGGLGVASDLDSAVTSLRNSGAWQISLPSLQQAASCEEDGCCRLLPACLGLARFYRVALEPPFVIRRRTLHERDCVRQNCQTTSRFDAPRRCVVCDQRMVPGFTFFRCVQSCRQQDYSKSTDQLEPKWLGPTPSWTASFPDIAV